MLTTKPLALVHENVPLFPEELLDNILGLTGRGASFDRFSFVAK